MKFADPTNDFAFKKIFGSAQHTGILISLLNAILDLPSPIESVELASPYQIPKIEELKDTILDIKARDARGIEFIVEMQVQKDSGFAKRSLYYTAKSYIEQLGTGDDYPRLNQVFFIGILDFSIFDNPAHLSRHLILDQATYKQELKDFEFTFIELPKFNKTLSELSSIADQWIYFIKNAKNLTLIPSELEKSPAFCEAFEVATQTVWNKNELEIYDYKAMQLGKRKSELATAIEDGKLEGRLEGKLEGRLEGELEAKLEIARKLLPTMDNATIARITDLPMDVVCKLR